MTRASDISESPLSAADKSRQILLNAARRAFADKGLTGARVDEIARGAGLNKQMLYHYFGNKEGLYTAVLADVYAQIRRREQQLDLSRLPAEEAMRRLIEFSFDFLSENPDFVRILSDENVHGGAHLTQGGNVGAMNRPVLDLLGETLERGVADGVFRRGLDPLHVYLSFAGMAFFYFSNNHTLSRAFDRDLMTASAVAERRAHIVDFALNAVRSREG
ncbi:TetR/AcrR family transcriptional regulator [Roseovarius aestuarii]|nr:TetR/AcrR family transcriptional regulator [Roseovarius aestuarii]